MQIRSPKVIKQEPMSLILSHIGSFDYHDPVFNIKMTKSITTLTFGAFGHNLPAVEFGMTSSTDERVKIFAGMQALIKSCVDNAEDIKDRIHQILLNRTKPKTEEDRVELMKMDFMKVKKWFIDDIRSSKIFREFKVINSSKRLKEFSQGFNTFILDRNKYTHGQLCFLSPSYDFVLEYIETPAQRKRLAFVDTAILTSYNEYYLEIKELITDYNVIHQERTLSEYRNKQKQQ